MEHEYEGVEYFCEECSEMMEEVGSCFHCNSCNEEREKIDGYLEGGEDDEI